jgi:UDP-GlcNAc3NAcA epimerase
MYDAFLMCHKKAIEKSATPSFGDSSFGTFFLATVHRGENTDDPDKLRAIIEALDEISLKRRVVFPIHPRTRKAMDTFGIKVKNIQIVPPVGYYDMLRLLDRCEAVFTDSGGLQKESYFARKLCVTLRDETEWGELVESGYNILTGASKNRIVQASKEFVTRRVDWNSNLYGDGCAGEKIVRTIMDSPRQ